MSHPSPVAGAPCWKCWRRGLWAPKRFGRHRWALDSLAVLEILMQRSAKERRCVECGAPGTVEHRSVIVPGVRTYWMCAGCDARWRRQRQGGA